MQLGQHVVDFFPSPMHFGRSVCRESGLYEFQQQKNEFRLIALGPIWLNPFRKVSG